MVSVAAQLALAMASPSEPPIGLPVPSAPDPRENLSSQPQARAPGAKVNDRTRHVRIPALVGAHGVPLSEPEDLGHALGVDQVFGADAGSHEQSLHPLACVSGRKQTTPVGINRLPRRGAEIGSSFYRAKTAMDTLALIESPVSGEERAGGSNSLQWWRLCD